VSTGFSFIGADGFEIAGFRSLPTSSPKGVVQIAHGMAEHARRYEHLMARLIDAGYAVYANDHRGHGASAGVHGLGDFGPGGFQSVVDDMAALTVVAKLELPGLPLVLLGHSMGSFAAQLYLLDHASALSGLVLSGTAAVDKLLEAMMAGGGAPGLAALNAGFEPARTPFDWLSRDEAQVDAYIADPMCGFDLTESAMASVFGMAAGARLDPRLAAVRKDLPILVISGEVDPVVGPGQAFANALIESYAAAGLPNIQRRVYPGGRHEMFNETCRDEVEDDLVVWLDVVATAGQ